MAGSLVGRVSGGRFGTVDCSFSVRGGEGEHPAKIVEMKTSQPDRRNASRLFNVAALTFVDLYRIIAGICGGGDVAVWLPGGYVSRRIRLMDAHIEHAGALQSLTCTPWFIGLFDLQSIFTVIVCSCNYNQLVAAESDFLGRSFDSDSNDDKVAIVDGRRVGRIVAINMPRTLP